MTDTVAAQTPAATPVTKELPASPVSSMEIKAAPIEGKTEEPVTAPSSTGSQQKKKPLRGLYSDPAVEACKIHIAKLPESVDDEKLNAHCSSKGGVVTETKIVKRSDKIFAFVTFEEANMAADAVSNLDGTVLEGETLKVTQSVPQQRRRRRFSRKPRDASTEGDSETRRRSRGPRRSRPVRSTEKRELSTDTLFVANIPFVYNSDQLAELFSDYKVDSAKVIMRRVSAHGRIAAAAARAQKAAEAEKGEDAAKKDAVETKEAEGAKEAETSENTENVDKDDDKKRKTVLVSQGYGFVKLQSAEELERAMKHFESNEMTVNNKTLLVRVAYCDFDDEDNHKDDDSAKEDESNNKDAAATPAPAKE